MHGEKTRMWLKRFKIAIIEKNPKLIDELVQTMPQFENVDDMKQASALIKEGLKVVHQFKDETGKALQELKKHKDFLESTVRSNINKFDITS